MYSLIIADDEFIIRQGLMCFKWEKLSFKIIGSASDGEEVLEIMKKEPADLIITDIQMPIIDGLKLSEIIRNLYPSSKVIILTGYKNFEYAQKAISSGVSDYLLKPVDITEMENLILKIKSELDIENNTNKLMNNYKTQLKGSKPLAIENFLRNILEEKTTDMMDIQEKMNLLELYLKREFYSVAIFKISLNSFENDNTTSSQLKLLLSSLLNEFLKSRNLGYYYLNSGTEIIILFNFEQTNISISTYDIITTAVQEIYALLKGALSKFMLLNIHVGIGDIYNSISYVPNSYSQSIEALSRRFFNETTEVFYAWEEKSISLQQYTYYPYEKETLLLDAVMDGKKNDTIIAFKAFWEDLELVLKQIDPKHLKNMIIQLLNMLQRRLTKHGTSLNEIVSIKTSFSEFIETITTITELKSTIENLFTKATEYVSLMNSEVKSSSHSAVQQSVKYINENYNKKITLNAMAEKVYLNSSYFSVQFKKEMGLNFIDYIKQVRVTKAKELLKGIDLKAYEVSEAVGYKDYKYFTELFKEFTGFTPLEYRQKLITK